MERCARNSHAVGVCAADTDDEVIRRHVERLDGEGIERHIGAECARRRGEALDERSVHLALLKEWRESAKGVGSVDESVNMRIWVQLGERSKYSLPTAHVD